MSTRAFPSILLLLAALQGSAGALPARAAAAEPGDEFFEARVRPLLSEHCYKCHGPKRQKGGVRLDGRDFLLRDGGGEPVVVPGDPAASRLIRAVRHEGEVEMPPSGKLSDEEVSALVTWVELGAPWPGTPEGPAAGGSAEGHWAFQPIADPEPPGARREEWARTPIDRFILARLERAGLEPSPPADRRTLIRRATVDLTGLPPTPQEVESFERDASPDAFAKVADRLLASPRYGERWGRHWLDVARYADTKGYVFTEERRFPFSYTYRDWVVRALNSDLPYDRFIVYQIAADRLDLGSDTRPLAALGFLTLGRRFLNNRHDIIDDRIDVVTRGLMALTVQCARCHDHKYDPIPIADYYSLYGVFASSVEPAELPLLGPAEDPSAQEGYAAELGRRREALESYRGTKHRELLAELREATPRYLAAVLRGEEGPGAGAASVSRGELRASVVKRWKEYLASRSRPEDPVFGPWAAFLAAGDTFLESTTEGILALGIEGGAPARWNGRLLEALRREPPKSREDLARIYGGVLAAAAREELPAGGDPELAALREVLLGDGSPAAVPLDESSRLFDRETRNRLRELQREVDKLHVTHPGAPARAMSLADAPAPHEPRVFLRGKPDNPGPQVPRQFLEVLSRGERQPFRNGSGRLELAEAIASPENPLTARAIVNRVWAHHFGAGLVRSPGDFGTRSDPPAHPELLDWLASRFIADGWSLKALHRRILLSAVYQQESRADPACREKDPENRLLWRKDPLRGEFEVLRDSLLHVAGRLDLAMGGRPVPMFEGEAAPRRSIYGFIDRQNLPGTLRVFDFASPDATTPRRYRTTVPQQALYLMNAAFVMEQAGALVRRQEVAGVTAPRERIRTLYRRLYGRDPRGGEVALGLEYLGSSPGEEDWTRYAHALLVANEFAFID